MLCATVQTNTFHIGMWYLSGQQSEYCKEMGGLWEVNLNYNTLPLILVALVALLLLFFICVLLYISKYMFHFNSC